MLPLAGDDRLMRIAAALGMHRDDLLHAVPAKPPADWLFVDGTPDQFEVWAGQVLDPESRGRLLKIAAIVNNRRHGT